MNKASFPLRIQDEERARAKRLAGEIGISENRLYAELIHDGLRMWESRPQLPVLTASGDSLTISGDG